MLDEKLRSNYLKRNVNSLTARIVAEDIFRYNPELQKDLHHRIKLGRKYFAAFINRGGWRYGQGKGVRDTSRDKYWIMNFLLKFYTTLSRNIDFVS